MTFPVNSLPYQIFEIEFGEKTFEDIDNNNNQMHHVFKKSPQYGHPKSVTITNSNYGQKTITEIDQTLNISCIDHEQFIQLVQWWTNYYHHIRFFKPIKYKRAKNLLNAIT